MEEAIALTWKTMTDRMRNLRFGAVSSLLVILAMVLSFLVIRSGWVLIGFPVLIVLGSFFILREQTITFEWENRLMELWAESNLCMGIFVHTMGNHPHALKVSLKGLVAPLPENQDYITPPKEVIETHQWLFLTRTSVQDFRLFRAMAFNSILSSLPTTLWAFSSPGWTWILLGLSPICALPLLEGALSQLVKFRWKKRVAKLGDWNPDCIPDFQARFEAIGWARIPKELKGFFRH